MQQRATLSIGLDTQRPFRRVPERRVLVARTPSVARLRVAARRLNAVVGSGRSLPLVAA